MKLKKISESIKLGLGMRKSTRIEVGDVEARREAFRTFSEKLAAVDEFPPDVVTTDIVVTGRHGQRIPARVYRKKGSTHRGLMVFVHGGGMIVGSIDSNHLTVSRYVERTGITALAVGYRLAPEHPYPAQQDDVIEAVAWAHSHAGELNIDRAHIGLVGESAGGGIAAGVALRLRDSGTYPIACQLLVYPMLDDRTQSAGAMASKFLTWTVADNQTGWNALLEGKAGTADVPEYAAPARVKNLAGLPPTYVEVGTLDLFRDEDEKFANDLQAAGVEVEFHLRVGAPHGFEVFSPELLPRVFRQRAEFLAKYLGD
ncbi:unannotated protein [freshwater metagenome]|uniref:Unannotated protein n=1 Tax=freshwater metagenome TaxID=449393 RepID=A0A6J6MLM1_9ZZZZ|nr:alpha/beta hydrolase fold domain-containing protein [Actinomycetota bacterium]MSY39154.1 alpha/beta hydrolase fold domain-containing protein [Actinomycetota bacterium]MSZ41749.1 alpha/beta hydrolase fold domain-containing protein [Actinomycetota bacterium]